MKIIVINEDDGQYAIPLEVVAKNRTAYYAEKDKFDDNSDEWIKEVAFVMEGDFEGVDWLINNMNWADVKFCAIRINAKQVMREEFWTCSDDFEISEVDAREFPFSIWRSETRKNHPDKFLPAVSV